MTTPAQPVAPAPASTATEQAPASAREFFQQDDAALAKAWGVEAPPAEPIEEVKPVVPAVAPDPKAAEKADEGAVELKPITRAPMTEFSILDGEGEVEIPDVKIKFKAKGEMRELPLDHVVRLAQFGYANEEREQQVLAARKFVAESEQKEQDYISAIKQYEAHYDRLFGDPGFYEEARLAYLNQNSPEVRAQRAEQELQRVRQAKVVEQEQQHVARFVDGTLVPQVQTLLAAYPHVNEHEVIGRYMELTTPLLVNGRVPISRLSQVQRIVQEDLAQWVERTHVEREIDRRAKEDKQTRDAAAATKEIAQTKRQASRLFAHQGSASADLGAPTKPVKFTTAKDWLSATFPTTTE